MSKIKDLIEKLCPNGAKYYSLEDVVKEVNIGINPRRFFKLNPDDATGFYVTVRELNGLKGVKQYEKTDTINDEAIRIINERAKIEKGDVLFSNTGTVGKLALVNEKPTNWGVNEGIYIIKPILDKIDSKYLYYYLDSSQAYKEYSSKFTGSTLKHVTQKALLSLKISVPPIEVQREIVRILDNFTELINLLDNELKFQKDIYNEFVNQTFEKIQDDKNNSIVELKSITKAESKKNKGQLIKLAYSITKLGLIPTSDYFGETKITSEDTSNYKIVKPNWFVYSPSRIDIGSINYHKANIEVIVSPLNVVFSINENAIIPLYLLHYLKSHKGMFQILSKRTGIEGTGRKLLPYEKFSEIKIPLPTIEKQKEIVLKIQKFDDLCTTILPAEIEARQKQYEYYRDKLLTFKELV